MGISNRQSRVVYDRLVNKYYFILPDGSDREIESKNLLNEIDWSYVYMELYKFKLKNDIEIFNGSLKDILNLIDICI